MAAENGNSNGKNRPVISPESLKAFSASRLWLTDGAILYNDRGTCLLSWLFNLALYFVLCGIYNRIITGEFWLVGVNSQIQYIIPTFLQPINIFEFPAYVIIYSWLAALILAIPIMVSLLYNMFYALPFILVNLVLCHEMPQALSVFFACLAVSFEPLRFKSKFVSSVLCMAPLVLYWAIFAGPNPWQDSDALRWAIAYSPIAFTYLNCIIFFGVILLVGHVIRYKPFTIVPFFFLALSLTFWQFHEKIGFNERDFRAEVESYSPDNMAEFQDRSIVSLVERERTAIKQEQPYLSDEAIDSKIKFRWRWAFSMEQPSGSTPDSEAARTRIAIATAKVKAIDSLKGYMVRHPKSKRIADVLYYRALIVDMRVDQRALRNEESLRFNYDFPSTESELIWRMIQERFPGTIFAVEAKFRLAWLLAGRKPENITGTYNFDQAILVLKDDLKLCEKIITEMEMQPQDEFFTGMFAGIFVSPKPAIDQAEAKALKERIEDFISLIGLENRAGNLKHESRLAELIMLDPSQIYYEDRLKELLLDSPKPDPLQDNIQLELAKMTIGVDQKEIALYNIVKEFPERDGGLLARIALADLLVNEIGRMEMPIDKENYIKRAQKLLQEVIQLRPDTFFSVRAAKLLEDIRPKEQ